MRRSPVEFDEAIQPPSLRLDIDYLEEAEGARVNLPTRRHEIPVTLSSVLPETLFEPGDNRVLQLSGKNALRVDSGVIDLPADSPFTPEAWVWVEGESANRAVIAKTEVSEFGFYLHEGHLQFDVHVGGDYQSVRTRNPLARGVWIHVAGVYDLREVRLYVDGRLAAMKEGVTGPRKLNERPLYLGADPNARGQASRFFQGRLDEVRLSRVVRYTGERWQRVHRHDPDEDTVFLFHLDRHLGDFHPDHGPSAAHALAVGEEVVLPLEDLPSLDSD